MGRRPTGFVLLMAAGCLLAAPPACAHLFMHSSARYSHRVVTVTERIDHVDTDMREVRLAGKIYRIRPGLTRIRLADGRKGALKDLHRGMRVRVQAMEAPPPSASVVIDLRVLHEHTN